MQLLLIVKRAIKIIISQIHNRCFTRYCYKKGSLHDTFSFILPCHNSRRNLICVTIKIKCFIIIIQFKQIDGFPREEIDERVPRHACV